MSFHGLIKFSEAIIQTILVLYIAKNFSGSENLAFFVIAMYSPALLFSFFLGAIVDRTAKAKLLKIVLAAYSLVGIISFYALSITLAIGLHIALLLSFCLGIATNLYKPTIKSITKSLYSGKYLIEVNSLQSTISHSAAIVGTALGGAVMYYGIYFFIVFLSILSSLVGLYLLKTVNFTEITLTRRRSILADMTYGLRIIFSPVDGRAYTTLNCLLVYSIVPLMNFYIPYKIILTLKLSDIHFSLTDATYSAGMVFGGIYLFKVIIKSQWLVGNRVFTSIFLFASTVSFISLGSYYLILISAFLCGFSYLVWGICISEFQEMYSAEDQGKAISSMSSMSTILVLVLVHIIGNLTTTTMVEIAIVLFLTLTCLVYAAKGLFFEPKQKRA
jgi:MFS family permease